MGGADVSNEEACKNSCENATAWGCRSVTFYERSGWCQHFSTRCNKRRGDSTGISIRMVPRFKWVDRSTGTICNTCAGEHDISGVHVSNEEACKRSCEDVTACRSVTFYASNGWCGHFSTWCKERRVDSTGISIRLAHRAWKARRLNFLSEMKESQKILTDMLRQFDQICRRHNIRYWAIGGTLIGAVRNSGWVPWDGDVDVAMLVKDFPRFRNAIRTELPNYLWLQTMDSDPHYCNPDTSNCKYSKYLPKLRHLYSCYTKSEDDRPGARFAFHHGFQMDIVLFNRSATQTWPLCCSNWDAPTVDGLYPNDGCRSGDFTAWPRNWIFPLQSAKFEDLVVPIPRRIKDYMERIYEKYPPALPPMDQRWPHEGSPEPHMICPHHFKLYPDLYPNRTYQDNQHRSVIIQKYKAHQNRSVINMRSSNR